MSEIYGGKSGTKEYKREEYSYSKDGVSYRVSCKEIENGHIVCIYKSWEEGEGSKKEYKSENTETYYKENPFGEDFEKDEEKDEIHTMKGLKEFMQKLNPLIGK